MGVPRTCICNKADNSRRSNDPWRTTIRRVTDS